jgi:hypothetical protein
MKYLLLYGIITTCAIHQTMYGPEQITGTTKKTPYRYVTISRRKTSDHKDTPRQGPNTKTEVIKKKIILSISHKNQNYNNDDASSIEIKKRKSDSDKEIIHPIQVYNDKNDESDISSDKILSPEATVNLSQDDVDFINNDKDIQYKSPCCLIL